MPLEHYEKYKSHREGQWIMSIYDCERLQKIVKENDSKTILDLGSGIGASTYALAEATKGKVWAIEQSEKCHFLAKELMPVNLQVEFIHKEPKVMVLRGIGLQYFNVFGTLPKEEWDLVVIDGPGPFMFGSDLAELPNGDIFMIFHRIKPGCMIYVDARLTTVLLMKRYLFPYLELITEVAEGKEIYTLFRRNSVQFYGYLDLRLAILKTNGYFDE